SSRPDRICSRHELEAAVNWCLARKTGGSVRSERISKITWLAMHFERLLVGNVRYLGNREYDFTVGRRRLRQWNLLPAGNSSSALLRLLAVAGLGRRQLERLARQFSLDLAERFDQPVRLEFVQIRHAPQ